MIIFIFLLTFLTGFLITRTFLPEIKDKMLIFGYSTGIGITIESILIFIILNIPFPWQKPIFIIIEILILFYLIQRYKKFSFFQDIKVLNKDFLLQFIFFIVFIFVSAEIFLHFLKEPFGSWDGMFIWNFHSKFLYELYVNNMSYKELFNPILYWSHIDYPLLLPLYNYKNHVLYSSYNIILPAISAYLIFIAALSSIIGSIKEIINIKNALTAGLILISTKAFVWESMTQCADIILSLYILLSFISLCLFDKYKNNTFILSAFFFASSAAFCKNEGIVFFIVFTCLYLFLYKPVHSWHFRFMPLSNYCKIIVSFLPLFCLLYCKFLYWQSDLFENQTLNEIIFKLTDIERLKTILMHYCSNINYMWNIIILSIMAIITGIRKNSTAINIKLIILYQIIIMAIIYTIIYLITPNDLNWHLTTSSMRLTVQYIPLYIYLIFITFNCCDINRN